MTTPSGDRRQSVLITGSSSGLGLATAVELARTGRLVYASMRNPTKRDELDLALKQDGMTPDAVRVAQLDVADPTSVRSAISEIGAETGGRLDVVINNAGLNAEACFEDLDMADVRNLFETHVLGSMEVTRAALPLLRNSGDARIVFISSWAAAFGVPASGIYSSAKAAIERFAESLAWELAGDRISVSVVRPGFHKSDIFDRNSGRVRPVGGRYAPLYARIDPLAEKAIRRARDPDHLARKLSAILSARRPAFRYNVGFDSYLVAAMNPFVPQRLRRIVARRSLT